jgi:hypothetical protein
MSSGRDDVRTPASPTEARHDEWKRIEREAKDQALNEVDALEMEPLVFGQWMAWANVDRGVTCGITELHRVGLPIEHRPYTACSEPIPHPLRWLPLTTGLVKTMPRCRFCRMNYERQLREAGESL